jgi:hypothetical protein
VTVLEIEEQIAEMFGDLQDENSFYKLLTQPKTHINLNILTESAEHNIIPHCGGSSKRPPLHSSAQIGAKWHGNEN